VRHQPEDRPDARDHHPPPPPRAGGRGAPIGVRGTLGASAAFGGKTLLCGDVEVTWASLSSSPFSCCRRPRALAQPSRFPISSTSLPFLHQPTKRGKDLASRSTRRTITSIPPMGAPSRLQNS